MNRTDKKSLTVALLAAALSASACTSVRLTRPDGTEVRYLSVMQRKSLTIETPDGLTATYGTDSDASVELARELSNLAGMVAEGAAQGAVK